MPVQRIHTLEELKTVIRGGTGYLYNDFGGSKPRDCPIHHVTCPQLDRMLDVKPGNLSVKKAWCESLEELIRWVKDEKKVYAFCSDPSDPVGRAELSKGTRQPAPPAAAASSSPDAPDAPDATGTALPSLHRATSGRQGGGAAVLEAVAEVMKHYRHGHIDIRTEADLQGHVFTALLPRLEGRPSPLHANISLVSPREKLDIAIGRKCILELKVEADYPGVSKPVVFPEDVWKDLKRLDRYVREGIVKEAYFLMLDEDGAHARRQETAGLWDHVQVARGTAHWLFLAFPQPEAESHNP